MDTTFKMKNLLSKQTPEKIIKSTMKLFVKKGFHGTSISDISKEIKLTKGAIYCHFKSKDMLLKKILEEFEKTYLDKMIEEVRSVDGRGIDKAKHLCKFSLNFADKNRDLCLCLLNLSAELCSSKKKYERDIKKIYKKYYEFLADLLEEGKKEGSFREDIDCNILALNLIGANEGNLLQWSMNRDQYNNEKFSRSYMKFFLNGICRHK